MLDKLCSAASSWFVKIFLGVLLVSFVLWEIPSAFQRQSSDTLLTSGQSVIKAGTYQLALNEAVMRNSYALGRYLTQEEISQFAIPQRVFSRMYGDVVLDEEARQMKIAASDKTTATLLGQDPLFRGINGQFDKNRFASYVQQLHSTQSDFLAYLNAQAKRDQLLAGAVGGLEAPDALYTAVLLYQRETRAVDYLELTPAFVGKIADPDEKTLQDWFERNKARFSAPEYRQITYMHMDLDDIAHPQDVTQEAVQSFYEHNRQRYTTPEKRTIELLRFKTRQAADEAAAKLAAGTSFDKLAAEQKQTVADMRKGPLTKSDLPALMAPDVFALGKGAVSAVINDLQGPVIVRVTDIEPGMAKPLASVQEEIRKEIADKTAAAKLRDNRKAIENARFEGANLKELASEYGLAAKDVAVDANGKTPEGKALTDLPDHAILLPNVFQSAAGVDTDPLSTDDGYLWYRVNKVIPARERPLNEVREQAATAWKEQETQRLLNEKATAMKKELDDGATLDAIASRNRLVKNTQSGLQRGTINKKLGEQATLAAFSGPQGTNGLAPGADGRSRIVFKVTQVAEPLNKDVRSLSAQERQGVSGRLKEDLVIMLISSAGATHAVRINNELYNRLLQQNG